MNKADVIERLEEMETYLLNKSYSDLMARDHYEWVGYALELLREQEPEIIRCKDCEHSCDYTDIYPTRAYRCTKNGGYHDNSWFCADGERR